MSHTEERLSGATVFTGKIINVEHDTVLLENGSRALREVVRHRGAVGILVQQEDRLLLVRQYRYAVGRELTEIPAGKLEPGEEPESAALRELSEETGGVCRNLIPLGVYYGSPGILSEALWLYYARLEQVEAPHPDEDEFLDTLSVPLPLMEEMIADGRITDGKTIAAWVRAKARGLL